MTDQSEYSIAQLALVGSIHIAVGIVIVSISSFYNAELTFANWPESLIPIFLGFPIVFELARLFFGYLYDNYGVFKPSLIIGIVTSSLGVFLIQFNIRPIGNLNVILVVSLFYFGSSILTTLIDTNMTAVGGGSDRTNVAGVIQISRLMGFAFGGIGGSLLYVNIEFSQFVNIITLTYIFLCLISFFSIKTYSHHNSATNEKNKGAIRTILDSFIDPKIGLMTIFLLLFTLGLFLQDLILEPFAIQVFNFDRDNVGQVVAIWTSLTLIFTPAGMILEKKLNKRVPIIIGELLSFIGLLLFAFVYIFPQLWLFFTGLIFFGIGNGLASVPAISIMLDVAYLHSDSMSLLIGFFGILTTLGRSVAAILGGLILGITGGNYTILFGIEAVIVILGLIPLIQLIDKIKSSKNDLENNDEE